MYINGSPYVVSTSHVNYKKILECVKAKQWDAVPDLVNMTKTVQRNIEHSPAINDGRVRVDVDAGLVYFHEMPIHNVVTEHIVRMVQEGFDVSLMVRFLDNLLMNPSSSVAPRLYEWMEAGKMPITEDGCFLAYKRVRDDLSSFQDSNTKHAIGQVTEMDRALCDSDSNRTCSTGLHFCSHGYLRSYCSGAGRVLVLKINPKDVVAIPIEYGTHKGRCCRYEVVGELNEEGRVLVEEQNVLTPSVILIQESPPEPSSHLTEQKDSDPPVAQDVVDQDTIAGYKIGYQHGRHAKMAILGQINGASPKWTEGYAMGLKDGRAHAKRRYK